MREIVLDTETTGLKPEEGHRIVEIGAVELINHMPTGNEFHHYINPERDMPKEAESIHGISEAMLKDKPTFANIADAFIDFIGDATLIIHNAKFDIGFLNAELAYVEKPALSMDRVIDTVMIARRKFPNTSASLDALCRRFNIDLSKRDKHGALLDSILLSAVYLELLGGSQTTLGLQAEQKSRPILNANQNQGLIQPRSKQLPSRLTDIELLAHQALVKELGGEALWPTPPQLQ